MHHHYIPAADVLGARSGAILTLPSFENFNGCSMRHMPDGSSCRQLKQEEEEQAVEALLMCSSIGVAMGPIEWAIDASLLRMP